MGVDHLRPRVWLRRPRRMIQRRAAHRRHQVRQIRLARRRPIFPNQKTPSNNHPSLDPLGFGSQIHYPVARERSQKSYERMRRMLGFFQVIIWTTSSLGLFFRNVGVVALHATQPRKIAFPKDDGVDNSVHNRLCFQHFVAQGSIGCHHLDFPSRP